MPLKKPIALYLVIALFIISVLPRVGDTAFVPSEVVAFDRAADIEKIQKTLEIKVVKERLQALGLNQEELTARLDQLSDQQIHQLATKIDDLRIGQDDALGIIIALLVIILLVVLILHLTGHKVLVTK
ncbi:MAG: PA2779 family protein [Nitrospirae bacterium]|nr:PA2779 family protein [Nitrospirota bacterium]